MDLHAMLVLEASQSKKSSLPGAERNSLTAEDQSSALETVLPPKLTPNWSPKFWDRVRFQELLVYARHRDLSPLGSLLFDAMSGWMKILARFVPRYCNHVNGLLFSLAKLKPV